MTTPSKGKQPGSKRALKFHLWTEKQRTQGPGFFRDWGWEKVASVREGKARNPPHPPLQRGAGGISGESFQQLKVTFSKELKCYVFLNSGFQIFLPSLRALRPLRGTIVFAFLFSLLACCFLCERSSILCRSGTEWPGGLWSRWSAHKADRFPSGC